MKKWIKCWSVHFYPYDLDGTDKSIITCSDRFVEIDDHLMVFMIGLQNNIYF